MTAPVYSAITAAGRISELEAALERARSIAVALEQENERLKAAMRESCREESDESGGDRCCEPAEFVLWGKLLPRDAFGPRCYQHAVAHTHHSMPDRVDQWAVMDLRAALGSQP